MLGIASLFEPFFLIEWGTTIFRKCQSLYFNRMECWSPPSTIIQKFLKIAKVQLVGYLPAIYSCREKKMRGSSQDSYCGQMTWAVTKNYRTSGELLDYISLLPLQGKKWSWKMEFVQVLFETECFGIPMLALSPWEDDKSSFFSMRL